MENLGLADPRLLGARLSLQRGEYLAFACLTLGLWDWLIALSDEFDIMMWTLSRRDFNWRSAGVISAYLICRATSVGYAIITVVLILAKFDSCHAIGLLTCTLYGMSAPATALLFYFRVSAVYLNNRIAASFFALGWLTVTGCFAYDSYLGVQRFSSGPNGSCGLILAPNGKIDASSYASIAVYDTLVYLAISWRLSSEPMTGSHWQARLSSFFSGSGLYRLSRTLLRDGQFYYFTVGISVGFAAWLYSPQAKSAVQFTAFTVVMPALLACRVFRDMRLKAWAMQEKNMPTLAIMSTSGGSGIRQGQVEVSFSTEVVYEMTKSTES